MILKTFLVSIMTLSFLLIPAVATAQQVSPVFQDVCKHNIKSGNENSTVCQDASQKPTDNPLYGPDGVIAKVVNLLSLVVGIAAVIGIIVAGVRYLTSASNPEEANKARELVIYALIGLLLAVAAQVLVRAVLYNELF
ncbi:MAG TPA: pilin [Candidatus Saccharimonadales bacterium]|nr:pilin [Candidatus Saccharimonadales bacterium]